MRLKTATSESVFSHFQKNFGLVDTLGPPEEQLLCAYARACVRWCVQACVCACGCMNMCMCLSFRAGMAVFAMYGKPNKAVETYRGRQLLHQ